MMRRTTFLISALCLLILANVIMISFASPVFMATGEGFADYVKRRTNYPFAQGFKNPKKSIEDFRNYNPAGAKDAYQPMGNFDNLKLETGNSSDWRYTSPNESLNGPQFNPDQDNLFMFKNNQCKPECCGASYSCNGGCVCTTPDQRKYLNERGGNRTSPESGV